MQHRNQRHRGVGALAGKDGRRGWGAVGRADRRRRGAARSVHAWQDALRRLGARLVGPAIAGGPELSSTATTVLATLSAVLSALALYASQLRVLAAL